MGTILKNIVGSIFFIYILIAGISTFYFNYREAQDYGFARWVMLGEIESTLKGAFWPYFILRNYQTSRVTTEVTLSDDEWAAFERVLPTVQKPTFNSTDLASAKAVLKGFQARTGQLLQASQLDRQLRFNQSILEWRAEASASISATCNAGALSKTQRFSDLTDRFAKLPQFNDDVRLFDQVLTAASQHKEYAEIASQNIPVCQLGEMERPYRQAAAAYDDVIAGTLSDLAH